MALVAGVDSSTQSCKVLIVDSATGAVVRQGSAPHPPGTEVDPEAWWSALSEAFDAAGGCAGVEAIAVGGQQHGMVALDARGEVIRPALLWNDTRSAGAALDLIAELGGAADDASATSAQRAAGAAAWATLTGLVPVASFTVTKLRWLRDHEPDAARRAAAVALPHDWLTWRLAGGGPGGELGELTTDRSDASGTGYYSAATGEYLPELVERALGHDVILPRVLGPGDRAGWHPRAVGRDGAGTQPTGGPDSHQVMLAPGAGDNAAAALGLGMGPGDVAISIGTSGVVSAISPTPTADASGLVAGFADATGAFLPLACTLNGARILDSTARLLGVDHAELDALALAAPSGAGGVTLVPYFAGERTPNRPEATASFTGLTEANYGRPTLARAAVEALACLMADCLDAVIAQGVSVGRVLLIGGGARSRALREVLPTILGREVVVPAPGEYVARGAARQAAWALAGALPAWPLDIEGTYRPGPGGEQIRGRYAAARG